MVIMSFLVLVITLGCSEKDFSLNLGSKEGAEISVMAVILICIVFFISSSFIIFFFFFELALVPTLWLILKWGYQPERLQAGVFMMMYTSCASMPLMVMLLWIFSKVGTDKFLLVKMVGEDMGGFEVYWFFLVLSFLVKLPIFVFHSWLPKAHVEAPLSGSMLLAGVLLKLGGFGLCRVLWMVDFTSNDSLVMILVSSVWGGIICSCLCLCQGDLKALVAYSSIGHMSLCLCGIFSFTSSGLSGAQAMMLCHGLCSPLLFCLVGVMYNFSNSRSLGLNKGLLVFLPSLVFFWCCFAMLNMGFPISLNFVSELILISSCKSISYYFLPLFCLMCFLTGVYCFYMYGAVCHGGGSVDSKVSSFMPDRFVYSGVFCIALLFFSFLGLDFFLL
nr:NADH dehydrogenase subunit 4 [Xylophagaidae sp. E81]